MQWLLDKISWLYHLADKDQLRALVNLGGPPWVGYLILMAIIFSETGLLIGFFLPGDSLLFTAGFLSSGGEGADGGVFRIELLIVLLSAAAILGDAVNYFLGLQMEEHVFEKGRLRFVKHEHLLAAKAFYERHGGKAIVLARFVPLVRTFTPFVAGVARMGYRRFAIYNIAGGVGWVVTMLMAGYWLGNIPWVSGHFELVVMAIVAISLVPVFVAAWRAWRGRRDTKNQASAGPR
jgi:membrane-associated protein